MTDQNIAGSLNHFIISAVLTISGAKGLIPRMEVSGLIFIPSTIAAGTAAGFISGFFGVGGGILYVPVLDYFFIMMGIPPNNAFSLAKGTSLAAIVMNSSSAARTHHSQGNVFWKAVLWAGLGSVLGSTLSTQISITLDQALVKAIFGVFLFGISIRLMRGKQIKQQYKTERQHAPLLFGIGAASGFIAGFFGVGGGIIGVPFFMLLAHMSPHRAIGTSSAVIVIAAGVGVLNYVAGGITHQVDIPHALGFFHIKAWIFLAPSSIIAAHYGAKAAGKIDPKPLRRIFAGLVMLVALRFIIMFFL
jgi:uncharacterized protein